MAIDIGGLVLKLILDNPNESIEAWSKVNLSYFNVEYSGIYSAISRYYTKYGNLPNANELLIATRDKSLKSNLKSLLSRKLPEDIDITSAIEHLTNEYIQEEALTGISKLLDSLPLLDSTEVVEEINSLALHLDDKVNTSETVTLMSDISIIEEKDLKGIYTPLGFNNQFDAEIKAATQEAILIGGKKGSGKSIVSNNIFTSQYMQGNVGLMFSIEMNSQETFNRSISKLANVPHKRIRTGELTEEDKDKIAKVRCGMFSNGEGFLEIFNEDKDFHKLEQSLMHDGILKPDNQLIIVDNQRLTLADIDLNIQKFKSKFGDKLKVVVVDYVNQIEIDDMYSWKQQIMLSKQLKNFARKYDIVMVTPYQIDADGAARFAKGILDSADVAILIETKEKYIEFNSKNVRNSEKFNLKSEIDWDTLTIFPNEYIENTDNNESTENNETSEDMPF